MRPALLALLVCTLLLRHQLESREEYLRFWDHFLSGRSTMVLALSPQDRLGLASSLYPLVWVAGRYGIDATLAGDSLTGMKQDSSANVQVSYATLPDDLPDIHRRWAISSVSSTRSTPVKSQFSENATAPATVHDSATSSSRAVTSAALLTILPKDSGTLHIQGTNADAIRQLLEGLTIESNFPAGAADKLDDRHVFQILLYMDHAHGWHREVYWEGA